MGGNAELAVLISDKTNENTHLVSLVRAADTETENAVELCISETLNSWSIKRMILGMGKRAVVLSDARTPF